jgi:putative hydrolase of the HAD superfamily
VKVVFDFAGVLFHWRPHELLARLLPERAPTPQAAREFVETFFEGFGGDWGEFDRGTLAAAELAARIAQRVGLSVRDARRVIDAVPGELRPLPASVALLRRLHVNGCELYYLSNMPEPYAQHLEATHDFIALFKHGVFSARARLVKPEPEIFAHATALFGINGAAAVFIDDVADNVRAARAAGWNAIHFEDANQCERELAVLGIA